MTSRKDAPSSRNNVPDIIRDPKSGKSYKKGKFLGKVSVTVVAVMIMMVVVMMMLLVQDRTDNKEMRIMFVEVLCVSYFRYIS